MGRAGARGDGSEPGGSAASSPTGPTGSGADAGRESGGGWVRRFVGAPPRLDEMVELYRRLGHEVRLERPDPGELGDGCEECAVATALFRVIYTRRTG